MYSASITLSISSLNHDNCTTLITTVLNANFIVSLTNSQKGSFAVIVSSKNESIISIKIKMMMRVMLLLDDHNEEEIDGVICSCGLSYDVGVIVSIGIFIISCYYKFSLLNGFYFMGFSLFTFIY